MGNYLQYISRRQYNAPVYFGAHAIYLFDCTSGSLHDFIEKEKISYVIFTEDLDARLLDWPPARSNHIGTCLGIPSKTDYSILKESDVWRQYLAERGAKLIGEGPNREKIFTLTE
jgi:hypothetical protein